MERFLKHCRQSGLDQWDDALGEIVRNKREFLDHAKGNFSKFKQVVQDLPDLDCSWIDLDGRAVRAGGRNEISSLKKQRLFQGLKALCPWRKGPFDLFGVPIYTEWQSWMKWERFASHLPNIEGNKVLDIGSSNGYYMFKMAALNPGFVLGLEPQSSFYYQYLAIQKYLNLDNVFCLPIPYQKMPLMEKSFDLVLCMGILYHRKSPVEMLKQIHDSLAKGGQIVLENLVLDSRKNICLFPHDRYQKMRNVFFIPDLAAMESWLARAGFFDIRCVDVTPTTPCEQRKTNWIQTESLADFLDPNDPGKTVEGYPGPVRAIFMAKA
ncbi:MAG: tRNA 5-methoxyuridine(34)/uridine 5-oxyacetic acid(34) synthase CmoB [Desulfobacter sp.]|nr:tRNA 5-methoxyuridine(34)/uridine 5-oxyacetic acid(34) synthase CmoB [Desulfobacter sp.]WDP86673.1 MAG: tRNA 5-methoxyuridine(34)/uridine 5-oxyacetic acid(34) synthase CmoB [Desulfobacter sp.]